MGKRMRQSDSTSANTLDSYLQIISRYGHVSDRLPYALSDAAYLVVYPRDQYSPQQKEEGGVEAPSLCLHHQTMELLVNTVYAG